MARRFGPTGTPRSGDVRVNTYTAGDQVQSDVASDTGGETLVARGDHAVQRMSESLREVFRRDGRWHDKIVMGLLEGELRPA